MSRSIPAGGPVSDPPPPERFDPARILRTFDRHAVRYVLVGGLAAALHGSPSVTFDIDLTPEQSRENLERLAAALTELDAVRYTDPDKPMQPPTVDDFAFMVESFASPVGYIDVFRETQAVGGFDQLNDRAEAQLPLLYALREERGR